MKRTFLIVLLIVLVGGLVFSGCSKTAPSPAPVSAPAPEPSPAPVKPIELKLSTSFPQTAFFAYAIYLPWAKEIEEATGGRVKIVHYGAQSLAKLEDNYDAMVSGLCDLAVIIPGATPGRFPLTEISNMPMLFPNSEIIAGAHHELVEKYTVDTELREVKFLYVIGLAPFQLSTAKPVQKIEDLKGMKIRTEGKIEVMMVEALGATGVFTTVMDMYMSLERGIIEGLFLQMNAFTMFGINEIIDYRTKCDLEGRSFLMLMNKDTFNSLPPDIQKIFEEKSGLTRSVNYGKIVDEEQERATKELAEYDAKVGNPGMYVLPEDEMARWAERMRQVTDAWVKEKENQGLPARAMLDDAISLVKKYSK